LIENPIFSECGEIKKLGQQRVTVLQKRISGEEIPSMKICGTITLKDFDTVI
jgi:hypothetical protein